ncbi:MAG: galactose-1-phosphate uridylyltransferase [Candidatus Nitrosocaldus sp.]|nr:galactose-1-phosphate uridylyltransferase [Candidatus Nitrosocaldus sp.]
MFMWMVQFRKDNILDRLVIVNDSSSEVEGEGNRDDHNVGTCIYCPGNEHLTKPAVLVLVQKEGIVRRLSDTEDNRIDDWCVRVVPSSNPLVSISANGTYSNKPFYSEPAYGYHYLLVASREHCRPSYIPAEQWSNVLVALQDRVKWLYMQKGVSYVAVYMDYDASSGWHPNLNIVTFPYMPPLIEQEVESINRYINEAGLCPICNIVSMEDKSPRHLVSIENFTALCPWAPTYPYEFWIVPKRHGIQLLRMTQKEIDELATMLRVMLGGLYSALGDVRFSMIVHASSEKSRKQLHWHIEVHPRLVDKHGLEDGFGVHFLSVSPEYAASKLSVASRRELAKLVGIT